MTGAVRWIVIAVLGPAVVAACGDRRREPRTDEPASKTPPKVHDAAPAAGDAGDELEGTWAELTKDGAFHVAICVVGRDPEIGSMGSPEHSSTREPDVVREVACPPPLPEVPAPGRGGQALAARRAVDFGAPVASEEGSPVELVTIVEPGARRSRVRTEGGDTLDIDNARLVALAADATATPGDIVVGYHADVGAVRGVVVAGGTATQPVVMRLRGFGSGYFGELTLAAGSFRPVKQDLDPGSLVAIPLAGRVELAMVLGVTGAFIVTLDDDDRVRALHRSSAVAMPVSPQPKKGQRVWAPFVQGLEAARVHDVVDRHITAAMEAFPDDEKWYGDGCFIDRDLSLGLYTSIELETE